MITIGSGSDMEIIKICYEMINPIYVEELGRTDVDEVIKSSTDEGKVNLSNMLASIQERAFNKAVEEYSNHATDTVSYNIRIIRSYLVYGDDTSQCDELVTQEAEKTSIEFEREYTELLGTNISCGWTFEAE